MSSVLTRYHSIYGMGGKVSVFDENGLSGLVAVETKEFLDL